MFGRKRRLDALASSLDTAPAWEPLLVPDESHVYAVAPGYTPTKPVEESPYNDGGILAAECTMQYVHDEVFEAMQTSIAECPDSCPTLVDSWDVTQASMPRRVIELMYDGFEVIMTFEVVMDPDIQRPEEEEFIRRMRDGSQEA